jgi:hypothetical protein
MYIIVKGKRSRVQEKLLEQCEEGRYQARQNQRLMSSPSYIDASELSSLLSRDSRVEDFSSLADIFKSNPVKYEAFGERGVKRGEL